MTAIKNSPNTIQYDLGDLKDKQLEKVVNKDLIGKSDVLLLGAYDEQKAILSNIGLDYSIKEDERLVDEINKTVSAEKTYKTDSFTGNQIKYLCIKYNLRILLPEYFKGNLPLEIADKIKEFCEVNEISTTDVNRFFILAPEESFRPNSKKKDLILFYRRPDESGTSEGRDRIQRTKDVLVQVYTWGNQFSKLRQYRYLFSNIESGNNVSNRFAIYLITAIYFIGFILNLTVNSIIGFILLLMAIIPAIMYVLYMRKESSSTEKTDSLWNTPDHY